MCGQMSNNNHLRYRCQMVNHVFSLILFECHIRKCFGSNVSSFRKHLRSRLGLAFKLDSFHKWPRRKSPCREQNASYSECHIISDMPGRKLSLEIKESFSSTKAYHKECVSLRKESFKMKLCLLEWEMIIKMQIIIFSKYRFGSEKIITRSLL